MLLTDVTESPCVKFPRLSCEVLLDGGRCFNSSVGTVVAPSPIAALSWKVITLNRPLRMTFGVVNDSAEAMLVVIGLTASVSLAAAVVGGITDSSTRLSEALACFGLSTAWASFTTVTEKRDFLPGLGIVIGALGTLLSCEGAVRGVTTAVS